MDPFKLLTKGTKFSKSTTKSALVLPSAGRAQSQQVLGLSAEPTTNSQPVGKKRKRTAVTKSESTTQSLEALVPDFFTPAATDAVPDQAPSKKLKVLPAKQDVPEVSFSTRSEDECKQLLRKHKLKVTLMNQASAKTRKPNDKRSTLVQLVPQPLESFLELRPRYKVSRRLVANLSEQGYSVPTEVQLGAVPLLLGNDKDTGLARLSKSKKDRESHVDLLSIAPTGSGKTLAFLIPLIQGLLDLRHNTTTEAIEHGSHIKAIVVAPTHELADQIVNEARKLIVGTGLRVSAMQKGIQVLAIEKASDLAHEAEGVIKVDILVSTPLALVNALTVSDETRPISSVRYLVLDEADVLLDPLFRDQTLSIWKSCTNPSLQVSLWSATIGASVEQLAQEVISSRRKELGLSSKDHHIIRLIAGLKDAALPTVSHKLIYAATEQGKLLAIRQILHPTRVTDDGPVLRPPFLIFTQTIPRATALHSELLYDIPLEAGGSNRIAVLHSSLSDTARSDVMARFRRGEIWVLITTDLLSRGVDFRGVNGVVNYGIPTTSGAYVHRAGRTGRAGREGGVAITLYTKEDIPYIKNVANVIAASEKVHGKRAEAGEAIPKWLLDALPDVSKKTKKELKKRGVKERRAGTEESKTRISTKSGFQRREDNRRKGAKEASKKRKLEEDDDEAGAAVESDWGGIQD